MPLKLCCLERAKTHVTYPPGSCHQAYRGFPGPEAGQLAGEKSVKMPSAVVAGQSSGSLSVAKLPRTMTASLGGVGGQECPPRGAPGVGLSPHAAARRLVPEEVWAYIAATHPVAAAFPVHTEECVLCREDKATQNAARGAAASRGAGCGACHLPRGSSPLYCVGWFFPPEAALYKKMHTLWVVSGCGWDG